MSRPSVFTILHYYEVYFPLISAKLVSSAHLSMRSSMLHLLQVRSGRWIRFSSPLGKEVTKLASRRLGVSLSLTDKRASKSQMGKVLLLFALSSLRVKTQLVRPIRWQRRIV